MLITDQVATAPCTDCVQTQRPTFEAKPRVCRTPIILDHSYEDVLTKAGAIQVFHGNGES